MRSPLLAQQTKNGIATKFSLLRFYRYDIPFLFKAYALPFGIIMLVTGVAIFMGVVAAQKYPLPPETFPLQNISPETFENVQQVQFVPNISTSSIFINNVRVIILAAVFSMITFGSLTLALTLVNLGLVSFIIAQIIMLGYDPWLFVATFILPHGIFEIPAILIGMTFALRIGAALISPPDQLDLGQSLLLTLANFAKVLIFVIIPLLLVAAYIEANITPQIVLYAYGG